MSRHSDHTDRDWLYNKYVCEQLNPNQIADISGVDQATIRYWLREHGIRRRKIPKSRKRRRNKLAALEYKGGSCRVCGYNKCLKALEFHHVDPTDKKFNISEGMTRHWPTLRKEIDKCLLVCKNCHAEIHAEMIDQDFMAQLLREDMKKNVK